MVFFSIGLFKIALMFMYSQMYNRKRMRDKRGLILEKVEKRWGGLRGMA